MARSTMREHNARAEDRVMLLGDEHGAGDANTIKGVLNVEVAPEDARGGWVTGHAHQRRWLGHPVGIFCLAAVEMWERFSFYGMRASLVLYLQTVLFQPGNWQSVIGVGVVKSMYGIPSESLDEEERNRQVQALVSQLYGLYTSMCYLMPLLGGFLADRYVGIMPMLFAGCCCITLGHCFMVFHRTTLVALFLISLGTGFFKPNASTLVGQLYSPNESTLRDSGYSIFYCSVNAGAFLAPLVCGSLRPWLGYHAAFSAAGIGMGLSLFLFAASQRAGVWAPAKVGSGVAGGTNAKQTVPSIGATLLRYRANLIVIGTACVMAIVFWMVYEQSGNTMVLFINSSVDRTMGKFTVPTEWFQSINPFFILVFTPFLASVWQHGSGKRHSGEGAGGTQMSSLSKMGVGSCLAGLAYFILTLAATGNEASGENVNALWVVLFIAVMTIAELYLSPVGLSFISQASPPGMTGMMMGFWSLATSLGLYTAGFLGSYYYSIPHGLFFAGLGALALGNGLAMYALSRPLQRMLLPGGGACLPQQQLLLRSES